MKRAAILLVGWLLMMIAPAVHAAPTGPAGPGLGGFDTAMAQLMAAHGPPGGALAICKGGRLVLLRGYGWANREKQTPVDAAKTIFALASISKTFTATAILRLVDEGRLSLDDRVLDRLPPAAVPDRSRIDPRFASVTIRMVLQHTSGLPREGVPAARLAAQLGLKTPLALNPLIRGNLMQPLQYAPGTKAVYSNLGYAMLGAVLAQAEGKLYISAVRDLVQRPCGINDMVTLGGRAAYLPEEARRYAPNGALVTSPSWPADKNAAGGWVASALDLVTLLTRLDGTHGSPLLSTASMTAMLSKPVYGPRPNGSWFGLGWDVVISTPNGFSYMKNGSILGARTFFGHEAPDVDWAVVFNGGNRPGDTEGSVDADARRKIVGAIHDVKVWPQVDYFSTH